MISQTCLYCNASFRTKKDKREKFCPRTRCRTEYQREGYEELHSDQQFDTDLKPYLTLYRMDHLLTV